VTILVVDDELAVRRACARILKSDGFDVVLAENGQEALARSAEHPHGIRLAIIDVVMPGMTGPELASRLRERWRGMKVLFMSGYASTETGSLGSMDPAAHFLGKPFSADVLKRKVHEILGGASVRGA
jgi:DNA-binding NtrC family response regulator